jgi:ABC-type transporter Mla maintaining outer membrane lipid asymmetry permease subunit MlaE
MKWNGNVMIWNLLLVFVILGIIFIAGFLVRVLILKIRNKKYWNKFLDNMR